MFKKFRDGRDSKKTKEKSFFYQQLQKLLKMELKRGLGQKKLHIYSAATRFTVEMGRALTFFGFELLPQA